MKIPVLLPNIFDHPFTYESDKKVEVGRYVLVPFGKKDAVGVVWDQFENEKNNKKFKIKKIKKTFNINQLNENSIKFLNWFSEYNLVPKGMALKLVLLSGEAIEKLDYKLYKDFKNSEKKLWYIDDFDNLNVIENTLYRYILDDYSFCRSIVLLETGKWNPFMTRYCWLILLLNMGDAKSQRLWNSNYHYNRVIVEDFKIIIKNLNVPLSKNNIQY